MKPVLSQRFAKGKSLAQDGLRAPKAAGSEGTGGFGRSGARGAGGGAALRALCPAPRASRPFCIKIRIKYIFPDRIAHRYLCMRIA